RPSGVRLAGRSRARLSDGCGPYTFNARPAPRRRGVRYHLSKVAHHFHCSSAAACSPITTESAIASPVVNRGGPMDQPQPKTLPRRTFLLELAAIGLGTRALSACAGAPSGGSASPSIASSSANQIGLQLYTVRDLMEKDFTGTIERVAQIGYRNVEFAGYYNHPPEQVRQLLDRLHIVSTSSHIGAPLMRQDAAAQIRAAKIIGQDYITIPSYPFGREGGV